MSESEAAPPSWGAPDTQTQEPGAGVPADEALAAADAAPPAAADDPLAQDAAAEVAAEQSVERDIGDLEAMASKAAERDEYLALAQRTQADFENYRKRIARELGTAESRGVGRLARELLPALDNLERALTAASGADEQLIEGLRLVERELYAALERAAVERYGAPGERFDPALHEAVAQQPADGFAAGVIVEVYQPGYLLAGSVVRPARVLVAA
jgi:molecular chaperone GrpE